MYYEIVGVIMKKINVTFSIPEETNERLHVLIGRKKLSAFVTETLNKALENKMADLKKAYAEAANDPGQREVAEDWKITEAEGWE